MSIQVDSTELTCRFCARTGHASPLLRSMHGLYCANENCYSRVTDGNLVPSMPCEDCTENSFYTEDEDGPDSGRYVCIACGKEMSI